MKKTNQVALFPTTRRATSLSPTAVRLLFGFQFGTSLAAQAQVSVHSVAPAQYDCEKTNDVVRNLNFVKDIGDHTEQDFILKAKENPQGLMLECVYLQEIKLNSPNREPHLKAPFRPFTEGLSALDEKTLFNRCKASSCGSNDYVLSLLIGVCEADFPSVEQLEDRKKCVAALKPQPQQTIVNNYGHKPLPTWRKVVGGILVGLGAGTAVLGAVHMGIPVFRSEGGCVEYGLEHPCLTASRFGAGGALLGVGLFVIGGGVFTLAWPTGEYMTKEKLP